VKFSPLLLEGRLLKRYKRFLLDVELMNGEVITAHTANTGRMTGCSTPGSRVWLSRSDNAKRKYPHSWEIVEVSAGVLCGINTQRSNQLVAEAITAGVITELSGYDNIRHEVAYGEERSRIDLLLEPAPESALLPCYVEVKNVTLARDGIALFPDAVTVRGTKHLRELIKMVAAGRRAVIFYCVQRNDCTVFRPADDIDEKYAATLREALLLGVEALAYVAEVTVDGIFLKHPIAVVL
jgi:sugar fermentation stimulation protein A